MQNDTILALTTNLRDEKSLAVKEALHRASAVDSTILVSGETGTGKDFWVKYFAALHPGKPFLDIHCGDVPETLLESEWFGYKKGAFTGADKDYDGKWKKAHKGILFLNQVDLLGLNVQSRLLRIIERKAYYPLGSTEEVSIDTQFIFSTDDRIEQKVRDGLFRADLFYRISTFRVDIPPLRERKKDIISLLEYFAKRNGLEMELDEKAVQTLLDYLWPGNIRELENLVMSASVQGKKLTSGDVALLIKDSSRFFDMVKESDMSLDELEKKYIEFMLEKYKNRAKVARILQISRKSLYNKLKES